MTQFNFFNLDSNSQNELGQPTPNMGGNYDLKKVNICRVVSLRINNTQNKDLKDTNEMHFCSHNSTHYIKYKVAYKYCPAIPSLGHDR